MSPNWVRDANGVKRFCTVPSREPAPAMTDTEILDWLLKYQNISLWTLDDNGRPYEYAPISRSQIIEDILDERLNQQNGRLTDEGEQLLQNQKRGEK